MDTIGSHQQNSPVFDILQQIHDGKTHVGEYLSLIFKNLPIGVVWKNRNFIYQGCNATASEFIGYKDSVHIIEKQDLDICLKEKEALSFQRDDLQIMESGIPRFNIIEPLHKRNGESQIICTTKIPVYDNDQHQHVSGLVAFFSNISSNFGLLRASNEQFKNSFQYVKSDKNYYLVLDDRNIKLTRKQAECLTYLSMGKTIKQIANMLDCSSRTIEDHINLLKRKLGVYSTAELIDCFWRNPIRWFDLAPS